MWVPSGVVLIVIGILLFVEWLQESDRRQEFGQLHALMSDEQKTLARRHIFICRSVLTTNYCPQRCPGELP
jgi:hypothetical protein